MVEQPLNTQEDQPSPQDAYNLREEPRRFPREVLLFGAISLLLGAILRFVHVYHREFFSGEFFTLDYLTAQRPKLLEGFFRGQLPLYYEFMKLWAGLVGHIGEVSLRIPSVMAGLFACVAFFVFAQRYLRGTALAVCFVAFALNPMLVRVSDDATPFALVSLFTVLSNYFCIRSLDEGGRRNWVLYGISTAIGVMLHPVFWFLLLAQFIFAAARPRKTPRTFVLVSSAGIFILILLMIAAAVYVDQSAGLARKVAVETPSIGELARGIVTAVLGDFSRYGYGNREFIRGIMYAFVFVALALSFLYYRYRVIEASAVPENILWVDETQDVVGKWNRLSLASFLLFQWVTFLIPAFCIMIIGSFGLNLKGHLELFVVCVPSLLILIAAGIDAIPGKIPAAIMAIALVMFMAIYSAQTLVDTGSGVKEAFWQIKHEKFHQDKDALAYVVFTDSVERAARQYDNGITGLRVSPREQDAKVREDIAKAVQGKDRVFVIYSNDVHRSGKTWRSAAREWFSDRNSGFEVQTKKLVSRPEGTELYIYTRKPAGTASAK